MNTNTPNPKPPKNLYPLPGLDIIWNREEDVFCGHWMHEQRASRNCGKELVAIGAYPIKPAQ